MIPGALSNHAGRLRTRQTSRKEGVTSPRGASCAGALDHAQTRNRNRVEFPLTHARNRGRDKAPPASFELDSAVLTTRGQAIWQTSATTHGPPHSPRSSHNTRHHTQHAHVAMRRSRPPVCVCVHPPTSFSAQWLSMTAHMHAHQPTGSERHRQAHEGPRPKRAGCSWSPPSRLFLPAKSGECHPAPSNS